MKTINLWLDNPSYTEQIQNFRTEMDTVLDKLPNEVWERQLVKVLILHSYTIHMQTFSLKN